jgi:iron uptake system component EfeO
LSRRLVSAVALPLVVPLLLGACSDKKDSSANGKTEDAAARTIEVTLTDDGCEPRNIPATAGPTTFKVTNDGSSAVTEFEILDGSKVLGEAEKVAAGTDRSFSLTLKSGSYQTICPGGAKFHEGTLEVSPGATGAAADATDRKQAVDGYLTYVKGQADELVAAVAPFVAAVKAGDMGQAKKLFAAARYHYETIEPIAESFGDLDPAVDAREGDVPDGEWGGFHRIEKALWEEQSVKAMGPVADKLAADITSLRQRIDTVELEPATIANGAVELLNEVSTSKITGEEDRYVKPLLDGQQDLVQQLDQRFADVRAALDQHKATEPTGNGFALFTTLTPDQTRSLSTTLDTLAEPLSRVAALVLT